MSSFLDSPNEGHERKEKKTETGRERGKGQKEKQKIGRENIPALGK